jgi:class 3 adenylate cyclase
MEPKGFHRKLAAILSADVVEYSRLMQDDEAATFKNIMASNQFIYHIFKKQWITMF